MLLTHTLTHTISEYKGKEHLIKNRNKNNNSAKSQCSHNVMINGTRWSDKQVISNKIQKRLRTAFADKSSSHSLPTVTCHDGAASNSSRRVENSILCVNMFPANITQTATPRSEFQISCQHLSQNYPSSHSQTSLDKWSNLPPFRPFNVETSLPYGSSNWHRQYNRWKNND